MNLRGIRTNATRIEVQAFVGLTVRNQPGWLRYNLYTIVGFLDARFVARAEVVWGLTRPFSFAVQLHTERQLSKRSFSGVYLTELGPATGLVILGFRAHAFGQSDACCIRSGFQAAMGADAGEALSDLLIFTRMMAIDGHRKIGLTAPGCSQMTRDELSVARAFFSAQAWDEVGLDAHLSWLLAGPVPSSVVAIMTKIADTFAGHGLAFSAPEQSRVEWCGADRTLRVVKTLI